MMQVNNINYIVHVVICITRYYVKKKEKIIWEFMIIDLCRYKGTTESFFEIIFAFSCNVTKRIIVLSP